MNRCLAAEMSRLGVENLGNSRLLPALFALIRDISSRHPSGPELIRGSLIYLVFSTPHKSPPLFLAAIRSGDQHTLLFLRSVPGVGLILSLVILCEIHNIERFPGVQDFACYARLVKCKRESAEKTYGVGGRKIGNAYLKWAFSEAAVLFLHCNPEAQAWLQKKTRQYNKAKTLTIHAHKLGRAVYFILKRKVTVLPMAA